MVCPGNVLQYTCSSGEGSLGWLVGSDQLIYSDNSLLDEVVDVGVFEAMLTSVDGQNFVSTLTNPMVTLGDNGTSFQCVGGSSSVVLTVGVAGLCTILYLNVFAQYCTCTCMCTLVSFVMKVLFKMLCGICFPTKIFRQQNSFQLVTFCVRVWLNK